MIKDEFAKIEAELEVTDMNNYYVRVKPLCGLKR